MTKIIGLKKEAKKDIDKIFREKLNATVKNFLEKNDCRLIKVSARLTTNIYQVNKEVVNYDGLLKVLRPTAKLNNITNDRDIKNGKERLDTLVELFAATLTMREMQKAMNEVNKNRDE